MTPNTVQFALQGGDCGRMDARGAAVPVGLVATAVATLGSFEVLLGVPTARWRSPGRRRSSWLLTCAVLAFAALGGGALLAGCGALPRATASPGAGPLAIASPLPPTPPDLSVTSTPAAPTASTAPTEPTKPTMTAVATIGGAFGTPAPAAAVALLPAVREYVYYLKQAILAGDVGVLWARYPALRSHAERSVGAGTNAEAYWVNLYRPLHPFDADVSPEAYAPIMVKLAGDRADVAVHGSLSLLRPGYDFNGKEFFAESGAEFRVTLLLQRRQGTWTVVQTDWPSYGDNGWGRR